MDESIHKTSCVAILTSPGSVIIAAHQSGAGGDINATKVNDKSVFDKMDVREFYETIYSIRYPKCHEGLKFEVIKRGSMIDQLID